jgi:hypothetical protein
LSFDQIDWELPIESGILKDILSREPTCTLYHYTTQAGLLGIIEKNEIWATHTQFLNDTKEYRHAVDAVTTEIVGRLIDADGESRLVLADMARGVKGIENMNVCVCSFSEDRDSLSQWRAYGGATSGYAIGFNALHVAEMVRREEFFLAPCIYKPAEQAAVVQALIDKVFEQNMERLNNGETLLSENPEDWLGTKRPISPRGGNLAFYLHRYAPILKHEAFSGEKEWRIISRPLFSAHDRFGFRCGSSTLIPYYRVPIAHADRRLELDEVVVGPTPHIEQSCGAVGSFLVSRELTDVPVNPSAIPYRNW